MLLIDKIKKLNWFDFIQKIKDILLNLLSQSSNLEERVGALDARVEELEETSSGELPYTSFVAKISQDLGENGVVTEISDSIDVTFDFIRTDDGTLVAAMPDGTDPLKVYYNITNNLASAEDNVRMRLSTDGSEITILTDASGVLQDNLLFNTPFEIRIYN